MIRWLQARQDGVSFARAALGVSNVLAASEVNLVRTSMQSGFPNIIRSVIPFVALDLVSYSSYDTMCGSDFLPALQYIAAHHNRTNASPPVAVYVGEFGEPQRLKPQPVVADCIQNVVTTALGSFGAPYVLFWEVYGNQVDGVSVFVCICVNAWQRSLPARTHGSYCKELRLSYLVLHLLSTPRNLSSPPNY